MVKKPGGVEAMSDVHVCLEWIAYAARQAVEDVEGLGLSDDQVLSLGGWLSENRILNPPSGEVRVKKGLFRCACGCGKVFEAEYRTAKPKFKNEAHHQRYWRRRWRVEREGKVRSDRSQ
jgi:hypothetical protein